jgi:Beta propeller domain
MASSATSRTSAAKERPSGRVAWTEECRERGDQSDEGRPRIDGPEARARRSEHQNHGNRRRVAGVTGGMVHTARRLAAGLALVGLAVSGAVACTSEEPAPSGAYRLVFFDSCADALAGLRAATKAAVGPYGIGGGMWLEGDLPVPSPAAPPAAADRGAAGSDAFAGEAPSAADPADGAKSADYSGTNVHESGVDEPDLVKTDGHRIVTISDGRLSVVDVASRRLVGVVDLLNYQVGYDADLLLAGDHALVLSTGYGYAGPAIDMVAPPPVAVDNMGQPAVDPGPVPDSTVPPADAWPVAGASITLIDLASPRVLSHAQTDGSIVDARQVGSTVRIVTSSMPRLMFPNTGATDEERLAANQAVIEASDIDAWAPRLEVTTGGQTVRTQVGCEAISRPESYSGTSLLTVLTFDAGRDALDGGSPVTIAADGSTVYSNGTSLYVASDQNWPVTLARFAAPGAMPSPPPARTDIYKFDTTTTPPRFVGGGSVPGHLLNQYAMSEWDGRLRVAATSDPIDNGSGEVVESQSGVYVLAPQNGSLVTVGAVEGLGRGERIYSVRFVGPVGYVVTFRQTDPLYTVDLRNPTAPVVRGELKIPGYSAYLHPIDDTRLIGVGQDATTGGQTLGTQVSLFDVGDLSAPAQIAKYTLAGGYSEAEFEPHAFLYWPQTGLLVVPLESWYASVERGVVDSGFASMPTSGALVLRVAGDQIVEVGFVTQPAGNEYGGYQPIRRSLVTTAGSGLTLWTVSAGGLLASDPDTLTQLAWIPL